MSDTMTVKLDKSKFLPHPTGPKVFQCVDFLNYGECVSEFQGKPKSLGPKCAFVFRSGEVNPKTGDIIDVVAEFGAYMSPKANFRKFLESWRGRPFTAEEVDEGVPVERGVGKWVYLNIGHKTSASGRTYAIVLSAMPVPAGVSIPSFAAYKRPDYLNDRKAEYAKEAAKYREEIGIDEHGNPIGDAQEMEPQMEGGHQENEDDLPF